jgi:hypothetical protein
MIQSILELALSSFGFGYNDSRQSDGRGIDKLQQALKVGQVAEMDEPVPRKVVEDSGGVIHVSKLVGPFLMSVRNLELVHVHREPD